MVKIYYIYFMTTPISHEDWAVLTRFLPEGWEEQAYLMGALVRRRKIDTPSTLLRVLLIHLADGKSLRATSAYAEEAQLCQLSDVALLRRLRAAGRWLRWLAMGLRDGVGTVGVSAQFLAEHRVRVIDASMVSEPGSTGSDWRLHYALNLGSLACDTCEVTDCQTGEHFTNFPVRPGDVLLADRAYCNSPGIGHVVHQGGAVVVRWHSTALPLFAYRGHRFPVLSHLHTLAGTDLGDWNVYLHMGSGKPVKARICAIRKSRQAAEQARREILRTASKKQRTVKAETLEYADYVLVITTLTRHQLRTRQVLELYRARWQVEVAFKRLKSILDLGHLPKHDPESCKAWLYGKLVVSLLVEHLFRTAETFSPWGYPSVAPREAIEHAAMPEHVAGI